DACPTLRLGLDQALCREPLERFAKRRRADREADGESRGDELLARPKLAPEDRASQAAVHPVRPGARRRRLGRARPLAATRVLRQLEQLIPPYGASNAAGARARSGAPAGRSRTSRTETLTQ